MFPLGCPPSKIRTLAVLSDFLSAPRVQHLTPVGSFGEVSLPQIPKRSDKKSTTGAVGAVGGTGVTSVAPGEGRAKRAGGQVVSREGQSRSRWKNARNLENGSMKICDPSSPT